MGVWRSTFVVFILGIGMLCVPIFSYAQIGEDAANQTENEESSPADDIIRGLYSSPFSGLEIQLPSGWSGLELLGVVMITPDGLETWKHPIWLEASMIIVETDRPDLLERNGAAIQESLSQDLAENNNLFIGHCERQDYSYVTINDTEMLQGISECTSNEGFYSKTKTYAIMAEQWAVIMAFTANSSQSFMQYEPVFDESVSTITVDNTVSFNEAMIEDMNLNSIDYQVVMANGNPAEVNVQSNSNLSNFNFSEEAKQISFDVEGTNGTNGFAIVTAEKVLELPYTVTIDGQPTTDFFIFEDKIRGEKTMQINYQHSSHEIIITGTNVVPEFPYHMVGVIAAVIGIVAIVTRNIRFKENAAF